MIELNKIYNEDCLETMKRMPDKFVDLFYTDPPYAKKYHYTYEAIAKNGYRILKENGFCLVYTGPYWKDVIMKMFLDNGWLYFYDFILQHNGNTTLLWQKGIISGYKSILCFTKRAGLKPKYMGVLGLFRGVKGDKRFHKWGQPECEARYYIDSFTKENDIVYDAFAGAGTFPAVCKYLNRRYIASEIDKETYCNAIERINGQHTLIKTEQIELMANII